MGLGGSSAKQRKTRKFAQTKRMLNPNDQRLFVPISSRGSLTLRRRLTGLSHTRRKANQEKQQKKEQEKKEKEVNRVCVHLSSSSSTCKVAVHTTHARSYARREAMPTSLFFSHNEALVPPYRVIVDTNFINLSLENRVDIVRAMMDVLYAKGASSRSLRGYWDGALTSFRLFAAIPCISDCVLAELEKLGHQYRLALRCVHAHETCVRAGRQADLGFSAVPPFLHIPLRLSSPISLFLLLLTLSSISPSRPQRRPRPALRAPPLLAQRHLRRRLHREPCHAAQVLYRRDV